MSDPSTTERRRRSGRPALIVAAAGIAACGGVDVPAADETAVTETTTTAPDPTTITLDPTITPSPTTSTSTSVEPDRGVRSGDVISGEAELDVLDPIVTLTADEPWNVQMSMDGAVILADPERVSEFTRGLLLLEAKPFAASIDEWADANETATIESRSETQVGGLDAIVYDISYTGDRNLPILSATCCGGTIIVRNTEYYRVWMIETGRFRPLALFASVLTDDLDWLDKAEHLVATIEIASEPESEPSGPEPDPADLLGTWKSGGVTWQIDADSMVSTVPGGIVESSYTATDTTYEITDVSGRIACAPSQVGTYEWAIVDDVLTVTLISDTCAGRRDAVDGRTFTRQESGPEESASEASPGDLIGT